MRIGKIIHLLIFGFVLLLATVSESDAQDMYLRPESPFSEVKESRGVTLYPNPTEDFLRVSLDHLGLDSPTFEVYSIIGNNMQLNYELNPNGTYSIDVRNVRPGYYILIVRDRDSLFKQAYRFRKQEI